MTYLDLTCHIVSQTRIQRKLTSPQLKHDAVKTLVEQIVLHMNKACELNACLLGMFTTSLSANYLSLVINNVTDPDHTLRCALHRRVAVYLWKSGCRVPYPACERLTQKQVKGYLLQESIALQHWFTTNLPRVHKVVVLPEEDILKSNSACAAAAADYTDVLSRLRSRVEELDFPSTYESNLPVVIFVRKINTDIVCFEEYLEAYLKKYAECFSHQRLICVFHLENLSANACPQIDLGRSDCHVAFFSAFDPSEKPISLLIADVKRLTV